MTTAAGGRRPLRLFVAAPLPRDAVAAIGRWQGTELAHRRDLRINRNIHLTLCFLGDTSPADVPRIQEALSGIPLQAMTVALGAAIFLPKKGKRRVVAVQLVAAASDSGGLALLQETQGRMSEALAASGLFDPGRRPWLPHITVARFRRPGQPFPLQNVTFGELCLSEVVLYTSDLDRSGAIHTPLASFAAR